MNLNPTRAARRRTNKARARAPYFESAGRQSRSHLPALHARAVPQSSLGSRRQQDAEGGPPTHGVRLTVSRRRLAATLMGVLAALTAFSTLGYFRTPRHEANECEQQEVSCCCTCLQHHRHSSALCGCGASVMFQLSVSRGLSAVVGSGPPNFPPTLSSRVVSVEVLHLCNTDLRI